MHTSYIANQVKSIILNSSYFNLIPNTGRAWLFMIGITGKEKINYVMIQPQA